jgi:hypothetical protein
MHCHPSSYVQSYAHVSSRESTKGAHTLPCACAILDAGGKFMLTGPKADQVRTSSMLLGDRALPGVSGTSTLLDLVGVLWPSSSSSVGLSS